MGASFYRLRCGVFQNLFLSPMNNGFVRPAVATVPTVYGIETNIILHLDAVVLAVATVPTVYGIETLVDDKTRIWCFIASCNSTYRLRY